MIKNINIYIVVLYHISCLSNEWRETELKLLSVQIASLVQVIPYNNRIT